MWSCSDGFSPQPELQTSRESFITLLSRTHKKHYLLIKRVLLKSRTNHQPIFFWEQSTSLQKLCAAKGRGGLCCPVLSMKLGFGYFIWEGTWQTKIKGWLHKYKPFSSMRKGFLQYTLPKLSPSNTSLPLCNLLSAVLIVKAKRGKPFCLIRGRGFLSFALYLNRALTRKEAGSKDSREQRMRKERVHWLCFIPHSC